MTALFLQHLSDRGITLAECRQHDLDDWFAQASDIDKTRLRPFLRWAIQGRRLPRLQLPPSAQSMPSPIGPRERLVLIRRIHAGADMDLMDRVAALLVLLYAQSLDRVTRLTVDDIRVTDGQMRIALGDGRAGAGRPGNAGRGLPDLPKVVRPRAYYIVLRSSTLVRWVRS